MVKCQMCDGAIPADNLLSMILSVLWSFAVPLLYFFGPSLIGAVVGFVAGLPMGAIFGLDWNPLPLGCYYFIPVGAVLAEIVCLMIFYRTFTSLFLSLTLLFFFVPAGLLKHVAEYGKSAFKIWLFENFVISNNSMFCTQACLNDYKKDFNEKKAQWKTDNLDRIIREQQERERKRLERIEEKKRVEEEKRKERIRRKRESEQQVIIENESRVPEVVSDFQTFNSQPNVPSNVQNYNNGKMDVPENESASNNGSKGNAPFVPNFEPAPYVETPSVNNDTSNENLCCICLENKSNVLYFPCKHCSQCSSCSIPVKGKGKCPICRATVMNHEIIFIT